MHDENVLYAPLPSNGLTPGDSHVYHGYVLTNGLLPIYLFLVYQLFLSGYAPLAIKRIFDTFALGLNVLSFSFATQK